MKILLILTIPIQGFSQACDYNHSINDAKKLCEFYQGNFFASDNHAYKALNKVMNSVGLKSKFILLSCDEINNCVAVTYNGIRYILYDKAFMDEISTEKNSHTKLSILAHEIGHHLNGHTMDLVGYKNKNKQPLSLYKLRQQELEADAFSGYIMHKLGYSLNQAQEAINKIADNNDDSNSSHPTKNKRLKAIEKGYNNGKNGIKINVKVSKSKTAEEYFNEGYRYYSQENYTEAIYLFTEAIKLNKMFVKAFNFRGWAYSFLNKNNDAISDFTRTIELVPNKIRTINKRASLYEKVGNITLAINDYHTVESIDPCFGGVFNPNYSLALIYYNSGKGKFPGQAIYLAKEHIDNALLCDKTGETRFLRGLINFQILYSREYLYGSFYTRPKNYSNYFPDSDDEFKIRAIETYNDFKLSGRGGA